MQEINKLNEIASERPELTNEVQSTILQQLDSLEETLITEYGEIPDVFIKIDQRWKDVFENGWDDTNEVFSADLQEHLTVLEQQVEKK